jgi:uncharacterized protein (TIGR00255 family)
MTGYGKSKSSENELEIEVEIKSVNGRYLDIRTYLPRELGFFEYELRKTLSSRLSRGSVEVRINFDDHREPQLQLNRNKLIKYYDIVNKARQELNLDEDIKLEFLLNEPGVIENATDLDSDQTLKNLLNKALDQALKNLLASCETEAKGIVRVLSDSIARIAKAVEEVDQEVQPYKQELFANMRARMTELLQAQKDDSFEQRLAQELVIYIDRYDVQEEITRLRSHIETFRGTLNRTDDIGKSLNFVLQEMQREANTLGSKFSTARTFEHILTIKEEIEKCREIVQNVA